jgi:hypothetical protein
MFMNVYECFVVFVNFRKNYKKLITEILIYIIIFNKHFQVAMAFRAKSATNVPCHEQTQHQREPCPHGIDCTVLRSGKRCSNYHPPGHIVCNFDGRCKNESCMFRHVNGKAEPAPAADAPSAPAKRHPRTEHHASKQRAAAAADAPSAAPVERPPRNKEYPASKQQNADAPSAPVERPPRNKEYPASKQRAAAAVDAPSAPVERPPRNKEYPASKQQNAALPPLPNLSIIPPFAGQLRLTVKVSADGKSWEISYT